MSDPEMLLLILLLEAEVKALRSVLSEYDGDKSEYTQMLRANAFAEARNHVRQP